MKPRTVHLLPAALLCISMSARVTAPAAKPAPVPVPVPAPSAAQPNPLDDDLLVIKATPYHPKLVRDPFSAPTDVENANKGDLIDDIAVKGRIVTNGKV